MSEEILKALMQLFAILTSQEGGPSPTQSKFVEGFLKQQLSPDKVPGYFDDFKVKSQPKAAKKKGGDAGEEAEETEEQKAKRLKREERKRLREEKKKAEAAAGPPENETEEEKEKRLRKEAKKKEREALKAAEAAKEAAKGEDDGAQLTSMKDSVKTLGVCKKINKTLAQPQKVIAFIRLFELIWVDRSMNPNAKELMDTVAEVFNISEDEYRDISGLTITENTKEIKTPNILVVNGQEDYYTEEDLTKHINVDHFTGEVIFLKVPSVELYFVKAVGNKNLFMNGLPVSPGQVYLFPPGSTVKPPTGKPIYYSDIVSRFLSDSIDVELSFHAKDIEFQFPNGNMGLRGINIEEGTGKLVGIMGASGAGKSTLLNVLNGNDAPTSGQVLINGIDIHKEKEKVEGVVGYVPQDDLLLDDLTVYENLYYNAKLCLSEASEEEIDEMIINLLRALDLLMTKDLKVGNPLEKTISGGQRKRLNIGLELLREPAVIFMDEPTSGLSSRDSENILDLLKELVLKGKIIFVVIHQPSSDIYKMFDRMLILDVGGYPVYYGNPVEAVMYFKRKANQVNSESGECSTCGNVNPELIFNIVGAKLVDDYGKHLDDRKVSPEQWNGYYKAEIVPEIVPIEEVEEAAPSSLSIPSKIGQWMTFIKRDVLSKVKNKQYMYLNMLEAPALAFVLSFIVKYIGAGQEEYTFSANQNVPAYIFMSIVVSLFMGLMVSAEEIIKDAKIQKREKFLNLSRGSYLFSKVAILFTISAIQSFMFVLIGNFIIGVDGMFFEYWLVLFTVSCFANLLGLNISSTFNSVVTIYILIPLILIPQMILSGAMFSFDKINGVLGGGSNSVPKIAEVMVSRWAYEALVVKQFKDNEYEQHFYALDKDESRFDYEMAYHMPEVSKMLDATEADYKAIKKWKKKKKKAIKKGKEIPTFEVDTVAMDKTLKNLDVALNDLYAYPFLMDLEEEDLNKPQLDTVHRGNMKRKHLKGVRKYLDWANEQFSSEFAAIIEEKETLTYAVIDSLGAIAVQDMGGDVESSDSIGFFGEIAFKELGERTTNGYLTDIMKNTLADYKIMENDGHFEQVIDPIFRDSNSEFFAHFYAPTKKIFGKNYSTFGFNLAVCWFMGILLYITLYFEMFKKALNLLSFGK